MYSDIPWPYAVYRGFTEGIEIIIFIYKCLDKSEVAKKIQKFNKPLFISYIRACKIVKIYQCSVFFSPLAVSFCIFYIGKFLMSPDSSS